MRTADKEVIDSGYRETLRQDILEWSALGFDRSRVGPGQRDKAGRRSLLKTPIVEVQSRFRNEKKKRNRPACRCPRYARRRYLI